MLIVSGVWSMQKKKENYISTFWALLLLPNFWQGIPLPNSYTQLFSFVSYFIFYISDTFPKQTNLGVFDEYFSWFRRLGQAGS